MKRCPTCKRTYADDGFTFCLDDGALLSAPYDPQSEKPVSTIRSSGPPPTAVLPHDNESGGPARPHESRPAPLPPTIAGPDPARDSRDANQFTPPQQDPSDAPQKRSVRYIAIAVFALIVGLGGVYLFVIGESQCPDLLVRCISDASRTECYVEVDPDSSTSQSNGPISAAICSLRPTLGWQMPALPQGVSKVTWSASSGKIVEGRNYLVLDTTGLSGKQITVKADISVNNWSCSSTIPNSFVVPVTATAPAK